MLSAMAASTGGPGTCTTPSVASASVIECATVNAVTVAIRTRKLRHNEDESENEQQMVIAKEDVFDAMREVCACDGERSAGRCDLQPRSRGMNERGRARAIACLYAHEHVGDGCLQPDELDALAAKAARHDDDSPFDNRVDELAQPGLDDGAHPVRELQDHR